VFVPDISLLQSDFEMESEESRIPSFFLTVSLILLILSVGSYIGLYFYVSTLKDTLDQTVVSIKNLNLQDTSTTVGKLNRIGGQLEVLKQLRNEHYDASSFLDVLSGSVHPRVYYKNANFDMKNKTIKVDGVAANPASLSSQVGIYFEDDKISEYKISDVSLDGGNSVIFKASLKVK